MSLPTTDSLPLWKVAAENAPGQVRHDARPTSVAAAASVAGVTGEARLRVLAFIRASGETGCTDEQCIDGTGMSPSTVRPRRVELVQQGYVRDSGRTRETRSRRAAVVWVATEGKQ